MNLSRGNKIKFILYTGFIIAAMFLSWSIVRTETQTGNINVNMTVPTTGNHCTNGIKDADEQEIDCGGLTCSPCNTGCTGYCGPTPIITILASSTDFSQATISWTVDPGSGYTINTTSIIYGKSIPLASTTVVIVSGTEFSAVLYNLEMDTVYNFQIYADNNGGGSVTKVGQIKTEKATILNSLTILAKPEKRDLEKGLNYSAEATLFFLDQNALEIKQSVSLVLDASGTTTVSNIQVPEGTTMVAMLKTDSHLAKRLNGVNTTEDNLILDFTINNTFSLLAGDMAGNLSALGATNVFNEFLQAARQDDFVDTLDISAVVSKFNNRQSSERANLNGDDIVDAEDISMVLSNWNIKGNIWNN